MLDSFTPLGAPSQDAKRSRRRYQNQRRHFRNDRRAAAVRALTGARLHLDGKVTSLAEAALNCGSNVTYVAAAITLLQSEDHVLQGRVITGKVSLLVAARQARQLAELIAAFRGATAADRVAFARTVGPTVLFDDVLVPAT